MAALLSHAAQLRALQATMRRLDPQMAAAIAAHTATVVEADAVLRELGVMMATHYTLLVAAGHSGETATRVRARIDALIAPLPHSLPIAQIDGD